MVKVMASGVFDILHVGHLFYLKEAKSYGTELIVVVARDETVRKLKKRDPIVPEHIRLEIINSLKPVDIAILGRTDDFYKTVEEIKPDIIVLGFDQKFDEADIIKSCNNRGINVNVIRAHQLNHDLLATTKIVEKILSKYNVIKNE